MRTYVISADGESYRYTGDLLFGVMDAVNAFAKENLPGWMLTTLKRQGRENGHTVYSIEAVSPDYTVGKLVWVYEEY